MQSDQRSMGYHNRSKMYTDQVGLDGHGRSERLDGFPAFMRANTTAMETSDAQGHKTATDRHIQCWQLVCDPLT